MRRARRTSSADEDKRAVLVLGGTGLVGGAVVRGLLTYPWFRVLVATRRPWCVEAMLLKQAGASIVEVDFNYKHSLVVAMLGVKCVFLHTVYWENYSCTLEVMHGRNAVEAAVEAGVEHLVFDGTNYVKPDQGRVCAFLLSKLEIEEIIKSSGIVYTIVVLPFIFEHFLTVFRPFEIQAGCFALTLPLETCLVSCACLHDMALCVCKIIQQGVNYYQQKITLAAEMMSVQQMITSFTYGLKGFTFIDPEMTVEDWLEFEFPGCKDLAAMFVFYEQCEEIPDFCVTRAMNPQSRTMPQWIEANKDQLVAMMEEPAPMYCEDYLWPHHLRKDASEEGPSSSDSGDADVSSRKGSPVDFPVSSSHHRRFAGDTGGNSNNLSNNSDDPVNKKKKKKKRDTSTRWRDTSSNCSPKRPVSRAEYLRKFLQMDFSEVMKHRERPVVTDAPEALASSVNREARGAEVKRQASKRGSFFSLPIRAVRSLSRAKQSKKPPKSESDERDMGEFRVSVTSDEEGSVLSQSPVGIPLHSKSPVGIHLHDEGERAAGQRWRAGENHTATTASTGEPSSMAAAAAVVEVAAAAAKLGQTSVHELVREKIPPDLRWRRPRQSSYALAVIDRLAGDCSNNGNPQSDAVVSNDDHDDHHPHTSVKGSERRGAYDKSSRAGRRDTFLRGYPIVDAGAVFSDTDDDEDDDDDGDGDGLLPNTPIHNDVQRFLKNRPGRGASGLRGRVTSTDRYPRVPETAPSDDEGSSWTPQTPPASQTPPLTPPTSLTPLSTSSWALSESSSDEFAGSSMHRNRLPFFQHVIPNAYELHRNIKAPSSLCSSLSPERADGSDDETDGGGTGRSTVKALASWSSLASILLSSSDDKDINS